MRGALRTLLWASCLACITNSYEHHVHHDVHNHVVDVGDVGRGIGELGTRAADPGVVNASIDHQSDIDEVKRAAQPTVYSGSGPASPWSFRPKSLHHELCQGLHHLPRGLGRREERKGRTRARRPGASAATQKRVLWIDRRLGVQAVRNNTTARRHRAPRAPGALRPTAMESEAENPMDSALFRARRLQEQQMALDSQREMIRLDDIVRQQEAMIADMQAKIQQDQESAQADPMEKLTAALTAALGGASKGASEQKLRPVPPPTYNGDRNSFEPWLRQLGIWEKMYPHLCEGSGAGALLLQCLKGAAFHTVVSLADEKIWTSDQGYEHIKQLIGVSYAKHRIFTVAEKADGLLNLRRDKMQFEDFLQKFEVNMT